MIDSRLPSQRPKTEVVRSSCEGDFHASSREANVTKPTSWLSERPDFPSAPLIPRFRSAYGFPVMASVH